MNDLPIFFERYTPYTSIQIEYTTYQTPTIGKLNTITCKNTTCHNMNYSPINKTKTQPISNHPSKMRNQLQESPPHKDEYAN